MTMMARQVQAVSRPQLWQKPGNNGWGEFSKLLKITLLHLPLGPLLYLAPTLGLLHPLLIVSLGMYGVFVKRIPLHWIAYLAAYLTGFEVLWRMAGVPVFWEFGKYGVGFLMVIGLVMHRKFSIPVLPSAYLLFLIPSTILTMTIDSLGDARDKMSFNLSGPVALFISCWFFSAANLNRIHLKKILYCLILPIVTVGATTMFFTVQFYDQIQFGTESNYGTSGGFGPNQVSSILGLGAFVGMALMILYENGVWPRLLILAATLFLASQSVLTFSRGGMYNAVLAAIVMIAFHLQDLSTTARRLLPLFGAILLFLVFVFPFLNGVTGGKLLERFEDTGTTNRFEIIMSDFELLRESPVFGIGLGQAREVREKLVGHVVASHTEFSRLISEHGVFGILSMLALFAATLLCLQRQRTSFGRALFAGCVFWCAFFMSNSGMRLVAPSFLWGLIFATIVEFRAVRRSDDQPAVGSSRPVLRAKTSET